MMTDETTVSERIERAQSQEMGVSLIEMDPLIVQVHNKESDRIHTVIPNAMHCSCEDHTYRGTICKHILFLLQQDGHIGDAMREALEDHHENLELELDRLREQTEEVETMVESVETALESARETSEVEAEDVESEFEQLMQNVTGDS